MDLPRQPQRGLRVGPATVQRGQVIDDAPQRSRIDDGVPDDVMARLLRIPYFVQAYDEDGVAPDDFRRHPGFVLVSTLFANATWELEGLCAERIARVTGRAAD